MKVAALLTTAFLAAAFLTPAAAATRTAVFAGGCFWCVESDFDAVPGVLSTTSGYIGGALQNPTYENHEGHTEAVLIEYDDSKVSYDKLLDVFWHSVDPTDSGGQFCDRGPSYRTGVFAADDNEKQLADASKAKAQAALGQPVVTPVVIASRFWKAEDYHQNYYRENPARYKYYRFACGRDARIEELWGKDAHRGIAH